MAKAYELPDHPPLEFRHSMASALLSSGRPLTAVSARLGHEHFSTALQHYAHALPDDVDALGDHSVALIAAMLTDFKRPKATEIDNKSGAKVVREHERLAGRRIA